MDEGSHGAHAYRSPGARRMGSKGHRPARTRSTSGLSRHGLVASEPQVHASAGGCVAGREESATACGTNSLGSHPHAPRRSQHRQHLRHRAEPPVPSRSRTQTPRNSGLRPLEIGDSMLRCGHGREHPSDLGDRHAPARGPPRSRDMQGALHNVQLVSARAPGVSLVILRV